MIHNIMNQYFPISRRNRECALCNKTIYKKEKYKIIKFRYDRTIISFYKHIGCTDEIKIKE